VERGVEPGEPAVGSASEPIVPSRLWLRRGEIWMAAGPGEPVESTPELRERIAQGLLIGKPALITLAEAGGARTGNLPLELHAVNAGRTSELPAIKPGRFTWEPHATLPDFVEAFGRQVSLTAIALDHARRTAAVEPGVVEPIYDRT